MKNTVGSLRGIVLTLLMALGGIFILNISIRPIQEHGMFLYLYVFCFLSSVLIFYLSGKEKVVQSRLTLCNPLDYTVYGIWNSPGQNTGMGSLSLIPRIFPTQGSNTGLTHCRRILYQLADKGSPRIQQWVAYPFFRGLPDPGIEQKSRALQAVCLPIELLGKPFVSLYKFISSCFIHFIAMVNRIIP